MKTRPMTIRESLYYNYILFGWKGIWFCIKRSWHNFIKNANRS